MTDTPAIEIVETPTVACDGSGPANGHPRVFLTVHTGEETVCPYCSRRFKLAEGAKAHGH